MKKSIIPFAIVLLIVCGFVYAVIHTKNSNAADDLVEYKIKNDSVNFCIYYQDASETVISMYEDKMQERMRVIAERQRKADKAISEFHK